VSTYLLGDFFLFFREIGRLSEKTIVTFAPMVEKSSEGHPGSVNRVNKTLA